MDSEVMELKDRYKNLSKQVFTKKEVDKYMGKYYPQALRPYGRIKWKTIFKVNIYLLKYWILEDR